jgi:ComF family protein
MLSNATEAKFDNHGVHASSARRAGEVVLGLLRRALPQACALCAAPSGERILCDACASQMPRIGPACPRCALPSAGAALCGACMASPPPFAAAIAAWRYGFPADRLLQAFKYGGRLALAEPLALALLDALRVRAAPLPDGLLALPLAPRRQHERGFNQAQEIASRLARLCGVPLVAGLRRARDAVPQAGLSSRERARNVRGAFEAAGALAGRSLAIVDDVMTTGATLGAAAAALRAAGAARVEAWAVARTPPLV